MLGARYSIPFPAKHAAKINASHSRTEQYYKRRASKSMHRKGKNVCPILPENSWAHDGGWMLINRYFSNSLGVEDCVAALRSFACVTAGIFAGGTWRSVQSCQVPVRRPNAGCVRYLARTHRIHLGVFSWISSLRN